ALTALDQRGAEKPGPFDQEVPGVAVRHARAGCRHREFAGAAYVGKEPQCDFQLFLGRTALKGPDRCDLHPDRSVHVMNSCSSLSSSGLASECQTCGRESCKLYHIPRFILEGKIIF